uniref:Bromodomain containing 10 n=1 Tax=Leptobrachium leishanense TaxID=445787 RepID=A0A8C5LUE1_9ANUR
MASMMLKEQERKEAEEASQKEVEEWDKNLLALAAPTRMQIMWEIPAIGHFLCLAQQILNLPEIVFYELERCLLMPQCSVFLSKIMTSLLSPPHRRSSLHRRPSLPYRAWEAALRQKVQLWYTNMSQADKPERCAEKLGLCSQFFQVLGEVNPLEHKGFHELPFYQKVWLLKGLCDFVYETQSEVQDAVLGQPIHECREVILGYDAQENAYIHFPQFCGADVRVYKQKPLRAPVFPIPPIQIKRTPKIKQERSKCKYTNKCNGEMRQIPSSPVDKPEQQSPCHDDFSAGCHFENCHSPEGKRVVTSCESKAHDTSDAITGCCKENMEKPFKAGEPVRYGEPLSPGEVRILENLDKSGDTTVPKQTTSPLKENALKACQVHINGYHPESTDFICHRVAVDILVDHPILNQKKLKLSKMREKKRRKKKKKFKDILNANVQAKREGLQLHTLKSLKTETHNKMYFKKKRVKHKKHKSAKQAVSKKTISKKRKTFTSFPSGPEFELVCTNLDELRELMSKIGGELKGLENNKKKSEKWHLRKQAVKELRSTLVRLLNELLPWEPKLLKAYQRNRARLKKDYEDFKKQLESEHFTEESCSREECASNKPKTPATATSDAYNQQILKPEHSENLQKTELDMSGNRLLKKESFPRDVLPSQPKSWKRQCKQQFYTDNVSAEVSPRKRGKFSSLEVPSQCMEVGYSSKDNKNIESEATAIIKDSFDTSLVDLRKGTNPIQALLVKTVGNKVALTTQNASSSESSVLCTVEPSQVKSLLSCQTASPSPLQVIYKMPDGHCVSVDQNAVKIQMQPVIDSKTGEKLVQQVLLLPKNLFIQHKEAKTSNTHSPSTGESQTLLPNSVGQACGNVTPSVPITNLVTTDRASQPTPSVYNKNVLQSHSRLAAPQQTSFPVSSTESNKNISPVLASSFSPTLLPSLVSFPVLPDIGRSTMGKGNSLTNSLSNPTPIMSMDVAEAKQELKTVCIRDSQSILVRTRGGNTGVVKVQANQEQSSSVISPNSVFTFTPQLQSFLVSKSKTSASSTFASSSNAAPFLLPCFKASPGLSMTSPPVPGFDKLLMQESESNTKTTQCNVPYQGSDKMVNPSNYFSTIPATSSCLPSVVHSKMDSTAGFATTLSCNSIGQGSSVFTQAGSDLRHSKSNPSCIVQPDSTTTSRTEVISGTALQQVMLVSSPPILTPGNSAKINFMPTATSSASTTQKLLFINAQVPAVSSSSGVALQTIKPGPSSLIDRTFVKTSEQPQIILIPSTMGSPVKVNSAPIVSQVKDVKIGLTIGQTIVNNSGAKQNILPVNILQNTLSKVDENSQKGLTTPKTPTFVQVVHRTASNVGHVGVAARSNPGSTSTDLPSINSTMAKCSMVNNNIKGYMQRMETSLSKTQSSTTVGNTVAISTVKTGHLSSSVLLSTTQVTGHVKSVFSTLPTPHPSVVNSQINAVPAVTTHQPASKDKMGAIQFSLPRFPKQLATNAVSSPSVPTPLSSLSASKPGTTFSGSQAHTHILQTSSVPSISQPRTLSDSSTHQKIVLNTSTPLAPGTQITINGTRFIVPPQGLGAGNHMLLLSTNAKQGLPGSANFVERGQNNNTGQQNQSKQSGPIAHSPNQPFGTSKSNDCISTNPLVPAITDMALKDFSVTLVDRSTITCPQPQSGLQPLIVPALLRGGILQPNRSLPVLGDMPLKDSTILNPINSLVESAFLPSPKMSKNICTETAVPSCKSVVQHTQ